MQGLLCIAADERAEPATAVRCRCSPAMAHDRMGGRRSIRASRALFRGYGVVARQREKLMGSPGQSSPQLLELAGKIADGAPVDWAAEADSLDPKLLAR